MPLWYSSTAQRVRIESPTPLCVNPQFQRTAKIRRFKKRKNKHRSAGEGTRVGPHSPRFTPPFLRIYAEIIFRFCGNPQKMENCFLRKSAEAPRASHSRHVCVGMCEGGGPWGSRVSASLSCHRSVPFSGCHRTSLSDRGCLSLSLSVLGVKDLSGGVKFGCSATDAEFCPSEGRCVFLKAFHTARKQGLPKYAELGDAGIVLLPQHGAERVQQRSA